MAQTTWTPLIWVIFTITPKFEIIYFFKFSITWLNSRLILVVWEKTGKVLKLPLCNRALVCSIDRSTHLDLEIGPWVLLKTSWLTISTICETPWMPRPVWRSRNDMWVVWGFRMWCSPIPSAQGISKASCHPICVIRLFPRLGKSATAKWAIKIIARFIESHCEEAICQWSGMTS